jgi:hypothetical protein
MPPYAMDEWMDGWGGRGYHQWKQDGRYRWGERGVGCVQEERGQVGMARVDRVGEKCWKGEMWVERTCKIA